MRLIPSFLLALSCAACGDDDPEGCGEPVYGGAASDESWRTMIDGDDRVQVGAADAPVLTAPAEDAEVSASSGALTISWDSPIALGVPRRASPPAPDWLDDLRGLVEGTAWAHLPPVTGDIYWIRITVPGRECTVEGLTTEETWEVDDDAFAALAEASGQTVTIDVTSAYLTENRITEGPFRPASPRTISIVP